MRLVSIGFLTMLLVMGMVVRCSGAAIAIDFEERPLADLSRITNVYHGDATFLYAFLVIGPDSSDRCCTHVSAYDIGYRLICRENDIINHGFHRQPNWNNLDARDTDPSMHASLPGAWTPAAIGYWKLELKNGCSSRGELQIVPNPETGSAEVTLFDGNRQAVALSNEELSQDTGCHGMINQTYFVHRKIVRSESQYVPSRVIAKFMPGVIEMEGTFGGISNVVDPALRNIGEEFGLISIRRAFRNAAKNPGPTRSRTGGVFTPINRWDVYILEFQEGEVVPWLVNAVLSMPRCVYAYPDELLEPTACTNPEHVPNDAKVDSSWHLMRIGIPCAWDEGVGDPTVRVGVIDGGVDFHLADFGGGCGSGFKIAGGYDYSAPYNPDTTDTAPNIAYGDDNDYQNHGNAMTSVLGAITNNLVAVAGVAGGWGGYGGDIGPSIFHFKTRIDGHSGCQRFLLADAIRDAPQTYECDVLSVSTPKGIRGLGDLKGAVRDCYKNGTVLVAALANSDEESAWYPACYRNDWVICVQGTNDHPDSAGDPIPERRVSPHETPPYGWGADWPFADWPIPVLSVDVSSPAVNMCYIWGDSLRNEKPVYRCNGSGVSYGPPQVAGVVALMLSESPDLSVCDIEGMLAASCTDITTDCNVPGDTLEGWDKYTGWGRVNADSCLIFADPTRPCGYHVLSGWVHGGGEIADSQAVADSMYFRGPGSPFGSYLARRFEVRRGIQRPSTARFVWTTGIEGSGWGWTGEDPDGLWGPDLDNFKEPYCGLVPATQRASVCTLFSYVYRLKTFDGDTLGWYPAPPRQLEWQLRCLVPLGPYTSVSDDGSAPAGNKLRFTSAMPNPARGKATICFDVPSPQRVRLRVFDVMGREVRTILNDGLVAAGHGALWDGKDNFGKAVAPGVYLLHLAGAEDYDVRKILLVR